MSDLNESKKKKKGLWDNIHAKRARGERPAKKGEKDFPDPKSWKKAKAGSKKEGKIDRLKENKVVDSIANFLKEQSRFNNLNLSEENQKILGLAGTIDHKERFNVSQEMLEDIYEEFALKFVNSPFYESVTRAFRKINSYKYVSNPTFNLSLIGELKSTGVPEKEIEKACETVNQITEKYQPNERDSGWNEERLGEIMKMTREANNRTPKHEDPFNTPLSD